MTTLLERIAGMAACVGGNVEEVLVEAANEIERLRAKVEQMERQEPVVWMQSTHLSSFKNRLCGSQSAYVHCSDHQLHPYFKPLYALPGAKGEEK